jgi:hypothetical protein
MDEFAGAAMDRRKFLVATALSGAGAASVSACGGSSSSASYSADWTIDPPPVFIAGASGVGFDLAPSLPANVRRGGRFSVSASGRPLPAGLVLAPAGVLSLTGAAAPGVTQDVVFVYEEPPR